jgi:ribonuclease HI
MSIACDGYVGQGRAGAAWVCDCGAQGMEALAASTASHVAEWRACALALAHLRGHAPGDVALRTDSALVAKGLAARRPEMRGEAGELRARCRQELARLAERGVRVRVERVPRAANLAADALSRRGKG